MILLERAYVLMGRAVARDLLSAGGLDAGGLDLSSIHRLLRERCPACWRPMLDALVVVEEEDMPALAQRFQDEVGCVEPPLRLPPDAGHVVPRSVALWVRPDLADLPNDRIAQALRQQQGGPVTVVDDEAAIDATISFNRHLRDHVDFGFSRGGVAG